MNDLQVFQNSEFGELEVMSINDKPYFPATACAKMLGYQRPQDTIRQRCRYSIKHRVPHPQNPDKMIPMTFIPEGDLYRLIVHSKLPAAERFEKWVFDEVLPSIRQTGSYGQVDIAAIIAQTASAVCAEMTRQLIPLLQELTQPPEQEEPEEIEVVHIRKRRRSPRGTGSVECQPIEVQRRIRAMLRDCNQTYCSISEQLKREGIQISKSAIGRYAQRASCFPDYSSFDD